jgi:starch-binding outer membrane protein, SusD/RagB family
MHNLLYIKSNVKWSILILAISLNCMSCKKWLDRPPTNSIALPKTLPDLQALLDYKESLNEGVTPSSIEASADDYFILQSEYDGQAGNHNRVATYTWDTDPFKDWNDWKPCYYPVYVANLCLQQLNDIPRTNSNAKQWDNIKGSSLFLRSYYFLELSWTYAKAYDPATANSDLGISLRLSPDIMELSTRETVERCYQQIINDTKESVNYLPEKAIHCLRPSKAAAYGLLARAYLSMRQYENALKYADLALQINSQLIDFNGDPDIIKSFSLFSTPFWKYNKEVLYYTTMNSNHTTHLPDFGKIDSLLFGSYESNDLRKTAFFRPSGSYQAFKGYYAPDGNILFSGLATDELLLIRAECQARIGGPDKMGDKNAALGDLNILLSKRWKTGTLQPISTGNAKEALEIILRERRKELVMRGLRWSDLKRLNKEGRGITLKRIINGQTYLLPPNDNRYAQPLPEEIIVLTGMQQNPR